MNRLLAAHTAHAAAVAAHDAAHPFDVYAPLSAPARPMPSPEAEAGALIAERGLQLALATQLTTLSMTEAPTARDRAIADALIAAASESSK
jgi:hypothetical protein